MNVEFPSMTSRNGDVIHKKETRYMPIFMKRLWEHSHCMESPELEEELKECLFCLHRNEMMFDLEVDTDLIEQHIYERQALLARYRYLLGKARELGLHTILEKYQLVG